MIDNPSPSAAVLETPVVPDEAVEPLSEDAASAPPTLQFRLLRADDMLELYISLSSELKIVQQSQHYEIAAPTGGTIVVRFPTQHVLESRGVQPARHVFVRDPVLRFQVPVGATPIPLTAHGLLTALSDLPLIVAPSLPSLPFADGTPLPSWKPISPFTANPSVISELFLASRLTLSPLGGATRFVHAAAPVQHNGAVELWHTRLARQSVDGVPVEETLPLIGLRTNGPPPLPTASTDEWEQAMNKVEMLPDEKAKAILAQSRQAPGSLRARQLILSPLGAWADLRGSWPAPASVKSWRHEVAQGRDQKQRLAELGRMYPFGHEATKVTMTERQLAGQNGQRARLVQRNEIFIREEVKDDFKGTDSIARQFPFTEIELLTTSTPQGTFKAVTGSAGYLERGPTGKKRPFRYRCRGVDRSGRVVHFDVPLIFVPETFTDFSTLHQQYNALVNALDSPFVVHLNSQRIAVATPASSGGQAGTEVILDLAKLTGVSGGAAGFRPVVSEMQGWVPGIEEFGNQAKALVMRYAPEFTNTAEEFGDGNRGEVILQLTGTPALKLLEAKDTSGLLSGLEFTPIGLSRRLGPVAGSLGNLAKEQFDPAVFLGQALTSMKLFGVFPLSNVLSAAPSLKDAPRIASRLVNGARTQSFEWSTALFAKTSEVDAGLGRLRPRGGSKPTLTVTGSATYDPDTLAVHAETRCSINQVELAIRIAGEDFVVVPMSAITFRSATGQKPEVKVDLGDIVFGGVLRYLRDLTKLVDQAGFAKLNAIDLLPDGVRTSFNLPVPAIAVGIFVLENITFGARLDLPFKDRVPELALNFSTFDNPFHLTVMALGGGGSVCVVVNTNGDVSLHASLEFGAAVSVNLEIAKASVSIMGGIYFVLEDGSYTITGYLRVTGRAEVLCIASVAVELYMGLTYIPEEECVLGEAEIVAKIRVLFVRKTFRIPFRKKFGGSGSKARAALAAGVFAGTDGPPGFADAMDPAGWIGQRPWDDYCLAFAA